jgi:hypothetical protein
MLYKYVQDQMEGEMNVCDLLAQTSLLALAGKF